MEQALTSNIFPERERFDVIDTFNNAVSNLEEAISKQNKKQIFQIFNYLHNILSKQLLPAGENRTCKLIQLLYNFMLQVPIFDDSLQTTAAKIFTIISSGKHMRPKTTLPIKALLDFFEYYDLPTYYSGVSLGKINTSSLSIAISYLAFFISEEDGKIIIQKYRHQIGQLDTNSVLAELIYLKFLPHKLVQDYLEDFYEIIKRRICTNLTSAALVALINATLEGYDVKFEEHANLIFETIERLLNICISFDNLTFSTGISDDKMPLPPILETGLGAGCGLSYSIKFAMLNMKEGLVLEKMKQLTRVLDTLSVGKNSKSAADAVKAFFQSIIDDRLIISYQKRYNFYYTHLSNIVYDTIAPLMMQVYSKIVFNGSRKASHTLLLVADNVCDAFPELFKASIFEFALEHSFDYEASSMSNVCLLLVSAALPFLNEDELMRVVSIMMQIIENGQTQLSPSVLSILQKILSINTKESTAFGEAQDLILPTIKLFYIFVVSTLKGEKKISMENLGFPIFHKLIALVDDKHKRHFFNGVFEYIMDIETPKNVAEHLMEAVSLVRSDGQEVLLEKLLRKYTDKETPGVEKKRIAIILAASTSPHEAMIKRIDNLLDIAESDIKDEKKRKGVPGILNAILTAINYPVPKEFGSTNPGETEIRTDITYEKLKLEWDVIPPEVSQKALERVSNIIKPFFNGLTEFATKGDLKTVKFVGQLASSLAPLTVNFVKAGIESIPRTKEISEIIEIIINSIITCSECDTILNSSVSMKTVNKSIKMFNKNNGFNQLIINNENLSTITFDKDNSEKYFRQNQVVLAYLYLNSIKTLKYPAAEIPKLIPTIIKLMTNPYINRNEAVNIIKNDIQYSEELFNQTIDYCVQILENKHTEDELKTVLQIISTILPTLSQHKDEFDRVISGLITTEIDPKWEVERTIAIFIAILISLIPYKYAIGDHFDLLEKLAKCTPTLDELSISLIIRSVLLQTTRIPESILEKIMNILVDQSSGCRIRYIQTFAAILEMNRPHAPSIRCDESETDFVDRNVDGFWAPNSNSKKYTGPRAYTEKNVVGEFVNKKATDEYIRDLLHSLHLLHPDSDSDTGGNPSPIREIRMMWKALARILGPRILNISDEVLDLLDNAAGGAECTAAEYAMVFQEMRHWDKECQKVMFAFYKHTALSRHDVSRILNNSIPYSISGDRNILRFDGFLDVLKSCILEATDAILPQTLMTTVNIFNEGGWRITDKFIEFLLGIIPHFTPLSKRSINSINAFAQLITTINDVPNNPRFKKDFSKLNETALKLVGTSSKEEVEASALFLSSFLESLYHGISLGIDKILITMAPTIIKIVETANQSPVAANNIFIKIGSLPLSEYSSELMAALIESCKGKPFHVRQAVLMYLRVFVLEHMFVIPSDILSYLMKTAVPAFINDDNAVCQRSAMDLLSLIAHCIMTEEELADFAASIVADAKKGDQSAVLFASALVTSVSVAKDCPKWLPPLFFGLADVYDKGGPLSVVVGEAAKSFWSKHQYLEIPELEELRFAFLRSYYS